jgi:zinc finger CCCH domain-containing protein 13
LTPRELNQQTTKKMEKVYNNEKVKIYIQSSVKECTERYKIYEKNPEKHPLYGEEWKTFWSERYKELTRAGKDAAGYDYKPEWVSFWMKRMKELLVTDIRAKKADLRKKYDLTLDDMRKIEEEIESEKNEPLRLKTRRSRSPSPGLSGRRKPAKSPIEISDESSDDENYRRKIKKIKFDDDRSRSKYSDSPKSYHSYENRQGMRYKYSRSRSRSRSRSSTPEYLDDGPVNLISVCRLLSALETELGILAPKVIDLLQSSLSLERKMANSCDNLLLEESNLIFLDTVKEKLKGGLAAKIIDFSKVGIVKKAIQNISILMHETNQKISSAPASREPVPAPKIAEEADALTKAKIEIAKVLSASLAAQGRTNVSPEELEELVQTLVQDTLGKATEEKAPEVAKSAAKESKVNEGASTSKVQGPVTGRREDKDESVSGLENLTDEDLKTLLRNFTDLTVEEQQHLIAYLSKIEKTNPARVEKLRKYVNAGDDEVDDEEDVKSYDMQISPNRPKSGHFEKAQVLSDDEYNDDDIARSMKGAVSSSAKNNYASLQFPSISSSSSTLKNYTDVANDLMSSLLQSSIPSSQNSPWEKTYFQQQQQQQQQVPPFSNQMMPPPSFLNQQMPGMTMMQMAPAHVGNQQQWAQSSAQYFLQEMNSEVNSYSHDREGSEKEHLPYRKRMERPNIQQLTGKGKNKRV